MSKEETIRRVEKALKPFGWACGVAFWDKYYTDPWVFNLVNAVEKLQDKIEDLERRLDEAQLSSIEARNPGIDMEEVKRIRAGRSEPCPNNCKDGIFEVFNTPPYENQSSGPLHCPIHYNWGANER